MTNNCEKRSAEKIDFKSKNKIPREVRKWLRRKSLSSKALLKVKTPQGSRSLKDKIKEAEEHLSKSYFSRKIEREKKAINKI